MHIFAALLQCRDVTSLLPARIPQEVKDNSYIAQYPVIGTVQCALHVTSMADLFSQIATTVYSQLLIHTAECTGVTEIENTLHRGLTSQHSIRTRILLVESRKLCPEPLRFWIETSVRMSYCSIFGCNTNTSHHRGTNTNLTISR